MDRREFIATTMLATATGAFPAIAAAPIETVPIRIRSREVTGPLPHVWEECVGSDRAAITLRESWRQDIERAHEELGIKRVRFHGIFADELGVFTKTTQDRSGAINFRNVAEVYDGLVARGLSPLVEMSFMPSELATGPQAFGFYKANVTPPKSLEAWGDFIRQFGIFLVDRYGLAEVTKWPFEVWNEPNLPPFFTGKQADYFQLYKASAVALKSVSPKLQVGGPATSSIAWLPEFLSFCATENAPVDFVSTHAYAGDNQTQLFGKDSPRYPTSEVIPQSVRAARARVSASAFPKLPLYLDEWSSDSPALIAHVMASVLGQVDMMSHWVLSGTYEELGPFPYLLADGAMGWSQMVRGIPRQNYNTYRLLHALGDQRLMAEGPALASRRKDGGFAAMVWNLAEVTQASGIPGAHPKRDVIGNAKRLAVSIPDMRAGQRLRVRYVDMARGSPIPAWKAMGSPKIPTLAQIATLRRAAEIAPAEMRRLDADHSLTLDLPPEGVALIESA